MNITGSLILFCEIVGELSGEKVCYSATSPVGLAGSFKIDLCSLIFSDDSFNEGGLYKRTLSVIGISGDLGGLEAWLRVSLGSMEPVRPSDSFTCTPDVRLRMLSI